MSISSKFRFWRYRRLVRQASATRRDIHVIALSRLRMQFDTPEPGEDESVDEDLIKCVIDFFRWDSGIKRESSESTVDQYNSWLSQDKDCQFLQKTSYRLSHWFSTSETRRRDIRSAFETLCADEFVPLTAVDVRGLYTQIRNLAKSTHRLWKDTKAQKIDLRLRDLVMLIPWISSALICAGYIHNSIVYDHFDIDPTRFFSVGDYLATSLEQIYYALISLIGYIAGVICAYRRRSVTRAYDKSTSSRRTAYREFVYSAVYFAPLVVTYFYWSAVSLVPAIEMFLTVCLLASSQAPLAYLSDRYFANSISVYILATVLLLFFGSMFIGAHVKIAEIKSTNAQQAFEIHTDNRQYTRQNAALIGANAQYVFIWHRLGDVVIIPLTQVNRILFSSLQTTERG